ncbi:DUF1361 domain-containing protein [Staphylococcus arlettae]|uniref:DUF1361 domain-containing protein n=1 Tax=Staphylococcus arlettae TaxID=29378 RepID=UPI000E689A69|nr:DUF1361 domain-containing protein [Staphylococcus arlettae]RIM73654.1 DUF1361 domain-containing protein [Staphylococcus arlettae]
MKSRYIARIAFIALLTISLFSNDVYSFMTLNLILAYIPLELCYLLNLFKPKKVFEWPLFIIFSLIFIFMIPNTFYMVTDLIHLNQFRFNFYAGLTIIEWIYFTYLLAGVALATYCLTLIYIEINHFTQYRWLNNTIIVLMMFLNGLGVYMGRFLRFHSVYLINEPLSVLQDVAQAINPSTLAFIVLMMVLQLLIIVFMKGVRLAK